MIPLLQRIRQKSRALIVASGLLALSGFLTSCTQVNVINPQTNLELAPAPYFDNTTGIYFPGALGPLFRKPVVKLEERSPGLGLAISYRNQEARIDVFVYDLQAGIIPSGTDSDVIAKNFQDALMDLEHAASKRIYSQLAIAPAAPQAVGQTNFLHTRFEYMEGLSAKQGELYVAGVNSQILKIRTAKRIGSSIEMPRLLAYLGQAIAQSHLRGYGSISTAEYKRISTQLSRINLEDGLSEDEAISIAQIELVGNKLHNRYDTAGAIVSDKAALPDSATVRFSPYPSNSAGSAPGPVSIEVSKTGRAEILDAPR